MVVLTMCGCAVLCWWLCGAAWYYMHACVIVHFGGCCVLCPCACMWSVCAWGMCVYACLCVVGVAGWCVGVRVRLRCDGLGLVAVAWPRVCMCVCRGCGVCWCVCFCLCALWCGVCCDAVWTLLAAVACVDARVLCGLTATDWRLGGGWPAWWRGHWMYSM